MTEEKKIYKGLVMDNGEYLSVRGKLFEGKVVSAKNKNRSEEHTSELQSH